ncbi:MAG: V-type ATPase subunit [Candidatus Omnitrophota bacterium]
MTNYAYAVGRIRALEAKMLGPERLDRLANLPTLDNLLSEIGGSGYLVPEKGDLDFTPWFEEETEKLIHLCNGLLSETKYPFFYRLPADFSNLSLRARKETGLPAKEEGFNSWGIIRLPDLDSVWSEKGLFLLPEFLTKGLVEAKKRLADEGIAGFEFVLGTAVFNLLKEAAGESILLQRLVSFFVDRTNIRSFLAGGKRFIADGGLISTEIFRKNRDAALITIEFHYPRMKAYLKPGSSQEDPKAAGTFGLEEGFRDVQEKILEESRFISLGPEPVIAYYYRKSREFANLRRILSLKIRGC